ncbi:MAG: porin [Comamonas sp.]
MRKPSILHPGLAAVLSCCAAGVQASSQVQIYGFLAPMVDYISVSGASGTAPVSRPSMLGAAAYGGAGNGSVLRMQGSVSNIGFRGREDLGGGLAALFQLESGIQVDTGGITGNGAFFNRNTRVGLSGGFGTVFAGSWDTPNAWSHLGHTNGVRNPYAGDSSVIFLTPGFNLPHSVTVQGRSNGPADAGFNRRQANALQYWSPTWAGFSLRLAYGLAEGEKTAANGARYSPTVYGLGTEYRSGPVLLRYVHQRQQDYFGLAWLGPNSAANPDTAGSGARSSSDRNHRLIARYSFSPRWALQGTFDRLSYSTDGVAAGGVEHYSRNAYSALLLYREGRHSAWLSAGMAANGSCRRSGAGACNTDGLGASTWAVGYRHDLSKRTDVFASAYQVRNRANGQYGVFPRSTAPIAPGSRQSGLTLGLEHSF